MSRHGMMAIEVVAARNSTEHRRIVFLPWWERRGLRQPLMVAGNGVPDDHVDVVHSVSAFEEDATMAAVDDEPAGARIVTSCVGVFEEDTTTMAAVDDAPPAAVVRIVELMQGQRGGCGSGDEASAAAVVDVEITEQRRRARWKAT